MSRFITIDREKYHDVLVGIFKALTHSDVEHEHFLCDPCGCVEDLWDGDEDLTREFRELLGEECQVI